MSLVAVTWDLYGVLQGVGFRPTVARVVRRFGLGGWVRNQAGSVRVCLRGEEQKVAACWTALRAELPPQARLERAVEVAREPWPHPDGGPFEIAASCDQDALVVSIPADLRMCAGCRRDITDPAGRYFGYPFTTCTDCGPRYTVVETMPYDRARTSLKRFPLCAACAAEYADPTSRRFHAQSIACPQCGPSLRACDARGTPVADPLSAAREVLANGGCVAVMGIGGFLLAVDPFAPGAVERLRARKGRPHKPLAVMAKDVEAAASFCRVREEDAALLSGPVGPIVLLPLLPRWLGHPVMEALAPGMDSLGVMLPTSPLHHLLAWGTGEGPVFDLLVMTSGNRSGEPICTTLEQAQERLADTADLFLHHDREIRFRCDDSVVMWTAGEQRVVRRARGFAPGPLVLRRPLHKAVVAMGADLKNAVAVGRDTRIVLSPHNGDLAAQMARDSAHQVVVSLVDYLRVTPQCVAVDLHPDMASTRMGEELAAAWGVPVVRVQHHVAHAAAAMAEVQWDEAVALVFDGTGYGEDGTVWGAELLHVREGVWKRLGTFAPVPLPGGDAAVWEPARQAVARLAACGAPVDAAWRERLGIGEQEASVWQTQIARGLNAPQSHAAGRVFDAASALLGLLPRRITFEGQGAIWLEAAARRFEGAPRSFPFDTRIEDGLFVVDFSPGFARLAEARPQSADAGSWALGVHRGVTEAALGMVTFGVERTGCTQVVLSGGVFMNRIVCDALVPSLKARGFDVRLSSLIPVNDGGIAVGQVAMAAAW